MSDIETILGKSPAFVDLRSRLSSVAGLFELRTLDPGEVLYSAGQYGDDLALVISGELIAESNGYEVGHLAPGELAGEAAAFLPGEKRTATVTAVDRVELLLLSKANLLECREEHPWFYDRLLEHSLELLVRRVGETDAQIARQATGTDQAPKRLTSFQNFWKNRDRSNRRTVRPPV
jgi:CRP-like cAMP-binding protein